MQRVIAALAVVAFLAGCGGNDESAKPSSPPPGTTEQTVTEPTAPPPAALSRSEAARIARASLLRLSDLPSGWTASDQSKSGGSGSCDAIRDARRTAMARRTSPTFENDSGDRVEDVSYVLADDAAAKKTFAELTNRSTRACIADFAAKQLKDAGLNIAGEAKSGEMSVDPVADDVAAARLTFPVEQDGSEVNLTMEYVVVRERHALSLLTLIASIAGFDADLRAELARAAARRLEGAVGG